MDTNLTKSITEVNKDNVSDSGGQSDRRSSRKIGGNTKRVSTDSIADIASITADSGKNDANTAVGSRTSDANITAGGKDNAQSAVIADSITDTADIIEDAKVSDPAGMENGVMTQAKNKRAIRKNFKRFVENLMHGIFLVLGLITVGFVLLITVYLVVSGLPAIVEIGPIEFLFGKEWASTNAEPKFGILPFILTSIYGTAGAIVIGVPIGFLCAVWLSKLANRKVRAVMEAAIGLLAGIPSVVYGLVGMLILVPGIRELFNIPDGASLLAAMIVLAVMILPSIIKISMTSLDAVPKEYEDASLALGATPVETYFRVSVPAAKSGIAAAVVMGVGRAIGEAMAVMMVSGNAPNMPSLFESVRFLTTAVASEMSYSSGLQRQALFSIALVLFLFIMLINAALNFFLKRDRER